MSALINQLRTRMQEKHLSIAELERRAGVNKSAVKNILTGQSKKPNAETLFHVSQVLGCTIEDLLEVSWKNTNNTDNSSQNQMDSDLIKDPVFLQKTTQSILDLVNEKNQEVTFDTLSFMIKELYQYSMKTSYPNVDVNFAIWLLDRKLIEQTRHN